MDMPPAIFLFPGKYWAWHVQVCIISLTETNPGRCHHCRRGCWWDGCCSGSDWSVKAGKLKRERQHARGQRLTLNNKVWRAKQTEKHASAGLFIHCKSEATTEWQPIKNIKKKPIQTIEHSHRETPELCQVVMLKRLLLFTGICEPLIQNGPSGDHIYLWQWRWAASTVMVPLSGSDMQWLRLSVSISMFYSYCGHKLPNDHYRRWESSDWDQQLIRELFTEVINQMRSRGFPHKLLWN